jgi:hypothetical protein
LSGVADNSKIINKLKLWWLIMALATVTFWGEGMNSYGIPRTLYNYLISVSVNDVIGNGDKIVKIIPLSENTPKPVKDFPFIVKNSDSRSAIYEAFCVLEEMESLKGLKIHKSIIEHDKQNGSPITLKEYY